VIHADPKELLEKLVLAREMVQVGGSYRHRITGALYRVHLIVMRGEKLEPAVVYSAVDGPAIPWDRKLTVFLERFHLVEFSALPPIDPPEV
jgi:hypothetical protein